MPSVINDDYTVGIKREVVTALEPMFHDTFPIEALRNRVYVGLEYPFTKVSFPAIYITYNETELRNVGVGHTEEVLTEDGTPTQVKHWRFTGTINFNIMSLSPKERDELGAALVNILAFGESNPLLSNFRTQMLNSTYVDLQFLQDIIHPGGEVMGVTPWASETELVFGKSYSIDIFGEFYSNAYTGELIRWEHVEVHPYITGHAAPW